ncbi:MAG: hypothetical protein ABI230_12400 [Aestuariivirga sp.]
MKNWLAKIDWDRVIAIQQFITLAFFLHTIWKPLLALSMGQHVNGIGLLVLLVFLASLNLVGGWLLFSHKIAGYELSWYNMLLQVPTFKSQQLSYTYHGIVWTDFGILGLNNGAIQFDFSFNFVEGGIETAFRELADLPIFTIDILAIIAAIYLSRRWHFLKHSEIPHHPSSPPSRG